MSEVRPIVLVPDFLLSLDFSVLDVDSVFVDVSFLMVGPELFFVVADEEDGFIAGEYSDVACEFFDVFVGEFVEEMDDESAGDFVDLNPGGLHLIKLVINHSLRFVVVVLIELL